MLRKKILGKTKFINFDDPAIDFDNWEEDKRNNYFSTNFELPPIKEGENPVIWEFRQLTGREMYQVKMLRETYQTREDSIHPEISKFIIQHGVVGLEGVEIEDMKGNIDSFKLEFHEIDGTKVLTDECYYELLSFFQVGDEEVLSGLIYSISHC